MRKNHYLALHLEGQELKMALVQGNKNQYEILELETNVKPLDIQSKINSSTIVTGINGWDLFLREFSFNLRSKREILSVLPFQVESQLPYPLADLILFPIVHRKKETTTNVTLFALDKAALGDHLQSYQSSGIDPDVVSSIPSALQRFSENFFPERDSLIIYHLGTERSSAIAISDGKILISQTQNFGISTDSLDLFEKDLERLCCYLKKKCPSINELLLLGEESPQVTSLLVKVFSGHYSLPALPKTQSLQIKKYAIPIGLCLDAMKQDSRSVQFRTGNNLSLKKSKQRSKWIKSYLSGSLFLLVLTTFGSYFLLSKKETALFTLLNETHPTTKQLSIEEAVFDLESSLSKHKSPFPFALTVPKVSDVLVWAASHPKLQEASGEIEIKQLRYQLVKYPKLESPSSPYVARVELEFTTKSPRLAREFHDALLTGDLLVNPKQEILWKADRDHYWTSFYLNSFKGKKP